MTWMGWEQLDGVLTSGPGVSSWASGRLDVFVRGTDSALWQVARQRLERLGEPRRHPHLSPAAVSWDTGRIDVFVRGTDSALWHKWYDNGWSGWESLGGILTSEPAVCSWAPGRLDVFARGTDSAMWHIWYENGWSSWESLGGVLTSGPSVVSWAAGTHRLLRRGDRQRDVAHLVRERLEQLGKPWRRPDLLPGAASWASGRSTCSLAVQTARCGTSGTRTAGAAGKASAAS